MYGIQQSCIQSVVGRPERKRPLGSPICRCENNIKMDLEEVRWGSMDWIDVALDKKRWWAHVGMIMDFRIP
jgi:hypothetical protein